MGSDFRTVSGVCKCTAALHTEKCHPTKFTILTILQGVESKVACSAVGRPSPSGQELLLVYFGIPLFYPHYTHRTGTCGPSSFRDVEGQVLKQRFYRLFGHHENKQGSKFQNCSHYSYNQPWGFEHLCHL